LTFTLLFFLSLLISGPSPASLFKEAEAQGQFLDLFQEKKPPEEKPTLSQDIRQKLDQNQKDLLDLQKNLEDLLVPTDSAKAKFLREKKRLLEELNLYYEQILEAQSRTENLAKDKAEIEENLDAWSQKETPEILDANFDLLDAFVDHYLLTTSRLKGTERTVQTLQISLESAKKEADGAEKERRRVQEELDTSGSEQQRAELQGQVPLLKLESQAAQAKETLTGLELKNEKFLSENLKLEEELLTKKINWLRGHVQFKNEELEGVITRIEEEKSKLNQQLQTTRKEYQSFEQLRMESKDKYSSTEMEVLRALGSAYQEQISVLGQRYQRLDEMDEAWRRRFLAFNGKENKSTLSEWIEQAKQAIAQTQRQEILVNSRLSEIQKELQDVEDRYSVTGDSQPNLKSLLGNLQAQSKKLVNTNQDYLLSLSRELQLYQKLVTEISPQVHHLDIKERLGLIWDRVVKIWNFELTAIDDRPITVRKLILVLILLILGFRLCRHISELVERKVFPRFGLATGVAAALQTLIYYGLATILTLIVLYMVNVPLTLFTVLGGALAIGVGFGSQNIVRNFISGLILLMEQPIKIGDMVEMEDIMGSVERIGARSTRIRKSNNVHVIVPNGDFLEKKVINWTLSDDLVRIQVNVGVDYESPIPEVTRLIKEAVEGHPKVLKNHEPIVLFSDFSENSLKFEVHFWIRMRTQMDRLQVESDVRYRIAELFKATGIVFPYPQLDAHLDSVKPVEVRIVAKE
jgi:small-conductance mechanosensitive channel